MANYPLGAKPVTIKLVLDVTLDMVKQDVHYLTQLPVITCNEVYI